MPAENPVFGCIATCGDHVFRVSLLFYSHCALTVGPKHRSKSDRSLNLSFVVKWMTAWLRVVSHCSSPDYSRGYCWLTPRARRRQRPAVVYVRFTRKRVTWVILAPALYSSVFGAAKASVPRHSTCDAPWCFINAPELSPQASLRDSNARQESRVPCSLKQCQTS